MAIIVEEDPLLLGVPAQGRAKLLYFIHSGVQALLVPGLWWKEKGDTCHALGRARANLRGAVARPCMSGSKLLH